MSQAELFPKPAEKDWMRCDHCKCWGHIDEWDLIELDSEPDEETGFPESEQEYYGVEFFVQCVQCLHWQLPDWTEEPDGLE